MAIQVVAFDVHDTLARWPTGHVEAAEVQHFLGEFGVAISYQAYEAARQAVFLLDAPRRQIEGWTDFLALVFGRMDVAVSVDLLTALTAMHESRSDMVLFPDALEAVRSVKRAGLVACAYTTLPRFMLGLEAGQLGALLDHYFDCSAVGVAKGDRRFYERITTRLETEPGAILSVGDDPIGDCRLPREAGWQAVLLDRRGTLGDVDVGPLGVVGSLSELGRYYL